MVDDPFRIALHAPLVWEEQVLTKFMQIVWAASLDPSTVSREERWEHVRSFLCVAFPGNGIPDIHSLAKQYHALCHHAAFACDHGIPLTASQVLAHRMIADGSATMDFYFHMCCRQPSDEDSLYFHEDKAADGAAAAQRADSDDDSSTVLDPRTWSTHAVSDDGCETDEQSACDSMEFRRRTRSHPLTHPHSLSAPEPADPDDNLLFALLLLVKKYNAHLVSTPAVWQAVHADLQVAQLSWMSLEGIFLQARHTVLSRYTIASKHSNCLRRPAGDASDVDNLMYSLLMEEVHCMSLPQRGAVIWTRDSTLALIQMVKDAEQSTSARSTADMWLSIHEALVTSSAVPAGASLEDLQNHLQEVTEHCLTKYLAWSTAGADGQETMVLRGLDEQAEQVEAAIYGLLVSRGADTLQEVFSVDTERGAVHQSSILHWSSSPGPAEVMPPEMEDYWSTVKAKLCSRANHESGV